MQQNIIKPAIQGCFKNIKYNIFSNVPHEFVPEDKKVIKLHQEHSVMLNMVHKYPGNILLGDGIFTNKNNLTLSINAHDCIGLLVLGNNFCGAIHISWRNLYLGIVDKIFILLQQEGINLNTLQFIISPHLTEQNMEIKSDFKDLWQDHYYSSCGLKECFITKNNKEYFSTNQLLTNIIIHKYSRSIEQILLIPIDTYSNFSYASFRRNGLSSPLTNIITIEII